MRLVPRVKAFALPRMSKRATLKAPRRCVYNSSSLPTSICSKPKRAVYNTPCRASPLLCSWQLNWNLRDSRIVKTKAYSYALICICRPDLLPSCGLSARVTVAKIVIISEYCIKKERNFLKMLWVDVWLAVKLWLLPLCLYKNKKLFQQLQLPLLKTILRCFCKMAWHLYCSNRTNIQRARHQYISLYCS